MSEATRKMEKSLDELHQASQELVENAVVPSFDDLVARARIKPGPVPAKAVKPPRWWQFWRMHHRPPIAKEHEEDARRISAAICAHADGIEYGLVLVLVCLVVFAFISRSTFPIFAPSAKFIPGVLGLVFVCLAAREYSWAWKLVKELYRLDAKAPMDLTTRQPAERLIADLKQEVEDRRNQLLGQGAPLLDIREKVDARARELRDDLFKIETLLGQKTYDGREQVLGPAREELKRRVAELGGTKAMVDNHVAKAENFFRYCGRRVDELAGPVNDLQFIAGLRAKGVATDEVVAQAQAVVVLSFGEIAGLVNGLQHRLDTHLSRATAKAFATAASPDETWNHQTLETALTAALGDLAKFEDVPEEPSVAPEEKLPVGSELIGSLSSVAPSGTFRVHPADYRFYGPGVAGFPSSVWEPPLTLRSMIVKASCTSYTSDLPDDGRLISPESCVVDDPKVFDFGNLDDVGEAVGKMAADGYVPATIEQLLADAEKRPVGSLDCDLVGLGTPVQMRNGQTRYPYLADWAKDRTLYLSDGLRPLGKDGPQHRFLGVRKKEA